VCVGEERPNLAPEAKKRGSVSGGSAPLGGEASPDVLINAKLDTIVRLNVVNTIKNA